MFVFDSSMLILSSFFMVYVFLLRKPALRLNGFMALATALIKDQRTIKLRIRLTQRASVAHAATIEKIFYRVKIET